MPELSVVIPTYNRASALGRCLATLYKQSLPKDAYEVIVVVDGSTDETQAVLESQPEGCTPRVVWQENRGPGAARNAGVESARGEVCVFVDDDVLADEHLLATHLRRQRESSGVVGIGTLQVDADGASCGLARYLLRWLSGARRQLEQGLRAPTYTDCWSGNLSVARRAFLDAGGFATDLPRYEDLDLGYRLQAAGLRLEFWPDARGREDFRKSFESIARDLTQAGIASVMLARREPGIIEELPLGRYAGPGTLTLLARRLLLAAGMPTGVLSRMSTVFDRTPWEERWYSFLVDYFYWRGVKAAADRGTWTKLTACR